MAFSLGKAVRALRIAREMSASMLAEKAGISCALLSLIESDQRTPSVETAARLAAALQVPPTLWARMAGGKGPEGESDNKIESLMGSLSRLRIAQQQLKEELGDLDEN